MITYRAILRDEYYHTETLSDGICIESHPHEYTNFTDQEVKDSIEITIDEFREIIKTQNTGDPQEYYPIPYASN